MKRTLIGWAAAFLAAWACGSSEAQDNAGPKGKPRGLAGKGVDVIFSKLDKNGDGVLTRDEFPKAERFDALDADRDGKLTKEELQKGIAEGLKKLGERGAQNAIAARLKGLDTDGDGKISKAEFDAAFTRLDKDGDGFLSEDELKAAFAGGREGKPAARDGKRGEGKKTESPGAAPTRE
jgi:Ca2+-binding EF-hand superfamily protein